MINYNNNEKNTEKYGKDEAQMADDFYNAYLDGREIHAALKVMVGQLDNAVSRAGIQLLTDRSIAEKLHDRSLLADGASIVGQNLQLAESNLPGHVRSALGESNPRISDEPVVPASLPN